MELEAREGDSRKRELSADTDTDTSFSSSPVPIVKEKKEKEKKEQKDSKKQKMDGQSADQTVDLNLILKALNELNRKQDDLQKTLQNVATKDDIKDLRVEMEQMNKRLSKRIEVLENDTYNLKRDRDSHKNQIDAIKTEKEEIQGFLNSQRQKLSDTDQNLNSLQQYTRNWSLRFFGLVETEGETVTDCVDKVVTLVKNKLNVNISTTDIEIAHRTGKKPSRDERDGPEHMESGDSDGAGAVGGAGAGPRPGAGTGAKHRPIIVRFYSRLVRDSVLIKRKVLKDTGVSIGEDLTPENFKCLKKVQEHSGTLSSWSHRGKILAKLKNGVIIQVTPASDINKMIETGLKGRGRRN